MAKTPPAPHHKKSASEHHKKQIPGTGWLLGAVFLIFITTWLGYRDTLDHAFHFDDTHAIVNNEKITDFDAFRDISFWLDPNNRPLAYLTFALNYNHGKLDTTPYHVTNIFIHILCALLFFFTVLKIFASRVMKRSRLAPYALWIALFAAMIFALHPLQTQSVTYIVQRMTAMGTLFSLASLLAYLHARYRHASGLPASRYVAWYLLSAAAWIMALLSKQEAASLPLVILAAEFLFVTNKDGKPYKRYLLTAVALIGLLATAVLTLGLIPAEKGAVPAPIYFATQMKVILKYIQLSLIPLNLMLDYGYPAVKSPFGPLVLVSAAIHLMLLAMGFILRKKNPLIAFGIFLFYASLAVTSSVFPIRDLIFEHRLYMSISGFSLVVASLFATLWTSRQSKWLLALPALYLVVLGIGTYNRNKVWTDSCTLWEDTLKKSPGNTRAWLAVGDCYKQRNDYIRAMEHYNQSLLLDTVNPTTLNNRGNLKLTMNDLDGAIADYTTIINTSEESRNLALLNRGIAYIRQGEHIRAIADFTRAINTGEADNKAYFHRALTYVYLGDYPSAIADLKVIVEKDPADQDALFNLASALMNVDQHAEAEKYYTQLLSFNPGHLNALHYRGVARLSLGRRGEACADWQLAAGKQHQPSVQLLQKYCMQNNPQ